MCSNSAMKCHCARHLWRCNLTHWIPLSLTHQMSPSLNGDRQRGAPYCEIPRKLDNANSLSVRHLHRFVSKQAMTPEVKERKHGVQAIIQWWGLPCFCRSCYIERIWKDYFLNVNCFFVLQEFEVSSGLCGILFQTSWAELAQWFHFRYQTLVSKVRIHKPGIFGRLVINCQSIAALPWETGETSRGLDRIFETHAALQGCDSQDDAHRCTNTTYSRYHKRTVSAPSKKTNELLDGRPSWTWRIDPEKPSGLWRNMADPWVLLAWKLTHDSYIHHVFAIFCVLIMFTYIYATGSSSYAV